MPAEPSVRAELEQLLSESFAWVDHGEADRLPKVCGEGFVLHAPGTDLDLQQFEQAMTVRVTAPYTTRHRWSNLRVTDVDGAAVDVAFVVCAHRREDGAEVTTQMVADFADRWTRTPDGWRLTARTITPVFDVPKA
ncbi:MAG: SnoaL-like domain [Actinomycetota bacterium]|nr:SnoaL-like domain [Actinomycetota bacterium]